MPLVVRRPQLLNTIVIGLGYVGLKTSKNIEVYRRTPSNRVGGLKR
jgi:hypothetical protein